LVSSKEIPPGGEGKIDVTFKTERRKNINRKKITVTSNDPTNPRLQIEIVADLEQLLGSSPRRQWFGRMKQSDTITKTFTIEGKKLDDVKLGEIKLKLEDNKSAYTWKANDTKDDSGRHLTIDVTVDASKLKPGRFNDILIATTNIEKAEKLELFLSGEVMGLITANPRRLYFGQFELNKEMVKTVTFTANNDKPFKVLDVSIPEGEFKIDPWGREASTEHTLTVRLTPKLDRDRIRSEMTVKTDMDKHENIVVDIHAYKQRLRPEKDLPRKAPREFSKTSTLKDNPGSKMLNNTADKKQEMDSKSKEKK